MRHPARNPTSIRRWLRLGVALAVGLPGAAAQEPQASAPLAAKQEMVRDRLTRLQDHMYRLIETLKEQEPAQAQRLEEALSQMGELGIRQHLQVIVELLNRDQLDQAVQNQESLLTDLGSLLALLMAEADDPARLEADIKRLEALLQDVEQLITAEHEHLEDARAADQAMNSGRPDPRLAAAINDLIAAQQELHDRTVARDQGQSDTPPAALREAQADLKGRAEALAGELGERREAQAADGLIRAAQNMEDATLDMREDALAAALDAQEDAIKDLQQALEQLSRTPNPNAKAPELAALADNQSETAQDAKRLLTEMKDQGPATPGQDPVEMAASHMDHAAEQLGQQGDPAAAATEQEQALQQLEHAQAQMKQRLDELKRQLQQQKLADLEARFRELLVEQEAVNRNTLELHALGVAHWRRTHQLQAIEQGQVQQKLSGSAQECLVILQEDATTTVLPQMVEQLRDDMATAGGRLLQAQVAEATQALQQEITATLEDILEVLEQDPQAPNPRNQDPQRQQQATSPGEPPLLPDSAELKLLTQLQQRVFTRTQQANRVPQPDVSRLLRIAEKQKRIAEMTEAMDRKLKSGGSPPGAQP